MLPNQPLPYSYASLMCSPDAFATPVATQLAQLAQPATMFQHSWMLPCAPTPAAGGPAPLSWQSPEAQQLAARYGGVAMPPLATRSSPIVARPLAVPAVASAISPVTTVASTASGKKNSKEREYSEDEYRSMLTLVVTDVCSARKAAREAEFPNAERTLQRHAARVRADASLQTMDARRVHVASLQLAPKGNVDFSSRRLFSEDELDYFARALMLYADMGWPMDQQAVRLMLSNAAKKMGRVDWRRGDTYVVSRTYVAAFIKSRPELRTYKSSHIDPLRSKKATSQVCVCVRMGMHMTSRGCMHATCESVELCARACGNNHFTLIYFSAHTQRTDPRTFWTAF